MDSNELLSCPMRSSLPRTPSPSRQLPSNGSPSHQDEVMRTPRTPQPQINSTPPMPQPPEPPKVRIKRRRPTNMTYGVAPSGDASLCVAPSIELHTPDMSSGALSIDSHSQQMPQATPTLHTGSFGPLSKLQTSLPQVHESLRTPEPWSAHSQWSKGESITRPSSTWSELSDSSVSSVSSIGTSRTKGESLASPDSESADPFIANDPRSELMPSALLKHGRVHGRRTKRHSDSDWTADLDEHLWLAYMTYLSDPTVTPFKTLPGTAPPLGVCHRVARRAKHSWKGPRTSLGLVPENASTSFASIDSFLMQSELSATLGGSPSTSKPMAFGRSLSAGARRHPGKWPFSNSATRKRLRELCKHKPALSPHYQRLMHSRSPSPFESSSSLGHRTSSPQQETEHSTFSTRHMNVMLTASTASSMQPGNPLTQLSSSSPRTPHRSAPHVKSSSVQSTFGVNNEQQHRQGLASLRRLASPFQEKPRDDTTESGPAVPAREERTLRPFRSLQPPRPFPQQRSKPALEIHQPKPLSASMKRRAKYQLGEELLTDDPEVRQSFLEDVFRDPATANGKRRVRSRGFSLGAVRNGSHSSHQSSRQLSELFDPPVTTDAVQPSPNTVEGQASDSHEKLFQPQPPSQTVASSTFGNDAARRLGSPFVPTGTIGMSNTFPRSLFPQGLDSISNLESQRPPDSQRPDTEMTDPFTESSLAPPIMGQFAQSNSGTIRRFAR